MPKDFQPTIDALRQLIDKAKAGRLATPDEQAGTAAFRDLVLAGGKALGAGLELVAELPWYVPVNGTVEAWPQLTPARKRAFLAALKPLTADSAMRMRLSISRGLFKAEPDSASKLIVTTLSEMRKGGTLSPRDRVTVANVLIGKTKPWLLQLDLGKGKAAESKLLAESALEGCVAASPPAALAVMDWVKGHATWADLPDGSRADFARALGKWGGRWQKQVAALDLPEDMRQAVTAATRSKGPEPKERIDAGQSSPAPVPGHVNPPETAAPATGTEESPRERVTPATTRPEVDGRPSARNPQGAQGRERGSKPENRGENRGDHRGSQGGKMPAKTGGRETLSVTDLLRQVEARFEGMKAELQAARQQQPARAPRERDAAPSSDATKLRDENARLAEEVRVLRETLNDLAEDRFDVAISQGVDTDQRKEDPLAEYRHLLSLKLREELTRFQALNRENHVDGLPLLLDNLLGVLETHGVDVSNLEAAPAPPKRRY